MSKRARVTPTRLCSDTIICCISFLPVRQMMNACVAFNCLLPEAVFREQQAIRAHQLLKLTLRARKSTYECYAKRSHRACKEVYKQSRLPFDLLVNMGFELDNLARGAEGDLRRDIKEIERWMFEI